MKALIIALALAVGLGGCSLAPKSILDDPNFATAVGKAASATKTAAQKADEALDAICGNYQIVDAGFQLVALFAGDRISPAVRQSEAAAVDYLKSLCANRPKDAQAALIAAQKAYGVIVTIHDRFKS